MHSAVRLSLPAVHCALPEGKVQCRPIIRQCTRQCAPLQGALRWRAAQCARHCQRTVSAVRFEIAQCALRFAQCAFGLRTAL